MCLSEIIGREENLLTVDCYINSHSYNLREPNSILQNASNPRIFLDLNQKCNKYIVGFKSMPGELRA